MIIPYRESCLLSKIPLCKYFRRHHQHHNIVTTSIDFLNWFSPYGPALSERMVVRDGAEGGFLWRVVTAAVRVNCLKTASVLQFPNQIMWAHTAANRQTHTHWEAVLSWRTTSAEHIFISKIIYIMVSWNFYFMLWFVYCVLSITDYNMFLQPTNNIAVRRSRRTPLWQIQAQYQESSSALW